MLEMKPLTKLSLDDSIGIKLVPYQHLKPYVRRKLRHQWQQWDKAIGTKLHVVQSEIEKPPAEKHAKSVQVAFCRLRAHRHHAFMPID